MHLTTQTTWVNENTKTLEIVYLKQNKRATLWRKKDQAKTSEEMNKIIMRRRGMIIKQY